MKQFYFTLALVFFITLVQAQINPEDSTVQVIGFWDKGEKQSYSASVEKFKINGGDTTARERLTYDIDITIQDSTSNSYVIEWHYKNISTTIADPVLKKLVLLNENTRVRIRTDELGAIKEVINWQELRDHISKGLKLVKNEFRSVPNLDVMINSVERQFTTKEAIEGGAIRDIQQYYTFHGGKYLLGETLTGKVKLPNMFGGEAFDSDMTVYLDEINVDDYNSILRSALVIDPGQLTEETLRYLNAMAKEKGEKMLTRDDIKDLSNETATASRIHGSGWVIYSIETKTVTSNGYSAIEERVIEIK